MRIDIEYWMAIINMNIIVHNPLIIPPKYTFDNHTAIFATVSPFPKFSTLNIYANGSHQANTHALLSTTIVINQTLHTRQTVLSGRVLTAFCDQFDNARNQLHVLQPEDESFETV